MSSRRPTNIAMTRRLSDGEGGGSVARGVAPSPGEAPGLAHEDGERVRRLGIDGVAETKARHDGGGLPEADRRRWRKRNATGRGHPLYACARIERVMGWLRRSMQRTTLLRQPECACAGAECSEGGQRQGPAWR
jgi:hypothetical protein